MPPESQRLGNALRQADAEILPRLRSAEGHLRAVIAMVESGEPCEAVLHQLGAVQAALRAAGIVLVDCQVQQSAAIILNDPCPERRAETVATLLHLYQLLIKRPSLS